MFLLNDVGEGTTKIWMNGQEGRVGIDSFVETVRYRLEQGYATEWWVKATTAAGETGWVRLNPRSISNTACPDLGTRWPTSPRWWVV